MPFFIIHKKLNIMKSFLWLVFATALLTSCSKSGDAVNVTDLNQQFISAWSNKAAD